MTDFSLFDLLAIMRASISPMARNAVMRELQARTSGRDWEGSK